MPTIHLLRDHAAKPGIIGQLTTLQAEYYQPHYHFDIRFEAQVATELANFITSYHPGRDALWFVQEGNTIIGSIAIDGHDYEVGNAVLRWFLLKPESRGQGLGKKLLSEAIRFARGAGYERVYLHTESTLEPAIHLYEGTGFQLADKYIEQQWGQEVESRLYVYTVGLESYVPPREVLEAA
jgi:GNAT superfamily N-acetyltransferase